MEQLFEEIKKHLDTDEEKDHFILYLKDYKNSQLLAKQNNEVIKNSFDDFFNNNNVYYNKTSRVYFNYVENNFIPYNEDNIVYYILDYLTNNKECNKLDTCTKQTMKSKILRHIKDNYNIYDNIADSETIQYLLNFLVPSIFKSKEEAKFLMTVLGDIILKKYNSTKINIFTKTCLKEFLADLNKYISIYFTNINIFNFSNSNILKTI